MNSNGRAGEQAALYAFQRRGWQMQKMEPPVRIRGRTGQPGEFKAIFVSNGQPDYVGYDKGGYFIACEVKEAHGDSMPASRLSKAQRETMANYPGGCAFVGILWDTGFEIFPFIEKGSYKKGQSQLKIARRQAAS